MCNKKDCMTEDTGNTEKENAPAGNKETLSETLPDRLGITRRSFLAAGGAATGAAALSGMSITATAIAGNDNNNGACNMCPEICQQ